MTVTERPPAATSRSGPHQVLLAVYAVFTLSAGARSLVQLATQPGEAPIAYSLSLVAAITYGLGWLGIRWASQGRTAFASRMLWVELAGVLAVGTLSVLERDWFPDASVWSDYGIDYGFVPAVLPVAGLLWLRGRDPERAGQGTVAAYRFVAVAEAATWLGLLTGMFFKYVVESGAEGVHLFGPAHGIAFLTYVVVTTLTWRSQRWSVPVGVLALAASVPPFGTLAFEEWARRTGRLH